MPDKHSFTSLLWEQLYRLDTERLWKHHIIQDKMKNLNKQLANM